MRFAKQVHQSGKDLAYEQRGGTEGWYSVQPEPYVNLLFGYGFKDETNELYNSVTVG